MKVCSVGTHEYDADIPKLLRRRLKRLGWDLEFFEDTEKKSRVEAEIDDQDALDAWCSAISEMLIYDLSHFELARIVNDLSLSLDDKHALLPEAVDSARRVTGTDSVKRALTEHFADENHLNLEGFMRFRMQDILSKWELCVDRAAEEMLLRHEYFELMGVLSAFVRLQPPKMKEVVLVFHPDGSCTLSDDMESNIDYAFTSDGVVGVLVNLAPEKITVYDLSDGRNSLLSEALMRVFEDRIRFYR